MVSSVPQLRSVHTLVACSPRPGRGGAVCGRGQRGGLAKDPRRRLTTAMEIAWAPMAIRVTLAVRPAGRNNAGARTHPAFRPPRRQQQLWRTQCENGQRTGWAPQDPREQPGWPWVAAPPGHVFVVGRDGTLSHWARDRSHWHNLGGYIIGGDNHVAAIAALGAVEVFAIWNGVAIMRRSLAGE